jgi:hypothetical protein
MYADQADRERNHVLDESKFGKDARFLFFRPFVAPMEGNALAISNNDLRGRSLLCEKFHFQDVTAQISQNYLQHFTSH